MQEQKASDHPKEPIAFDIGRTFWTVAHRKATGEAALISLAEEERLAAVISEYEGEMLLGQHYAEADGFPPIMDIYKTLRGETRWFGGESRYIRGRGDKIEFFLSGRWQKPTLFFGKLMHQVLEQIRQQLGQRGTLELLAVIPPDLPLPVMSQIRRMLEQEDARLVAWLTSLQATAYSYTPLHQEAHRLAIVAHVERGALAIGLIEIQHGFPWPHQTRNMEWPAEEPFPVDRVPQLVDELLQSLEDQHRWRIKDIEYLLVSGEEAWTPHLAQAIESRLLCHATPLPQPHIAMALGAAQLAQHLALGAFLQRPRRLDQDAQIALKGMGTPDAEITVTEGGQGGAQIGLDGLFELPLRLHNNASTITLQIDAPDQPSRYLLFPLRQRPGTSTSSSFSSTSSEKIASASDYQDATANEEDEEISARHQTARHGGLRGLWTTPLWLTLLDTQEHIPLCKPFSSLPLRVSHPLTFQHPSQSIQIVEGEAPAADDAMVYGRLSLDAFANLASLGESVEIEVIANQDGLLEVCARLPQNPQHEIAQAWQRLQTQPLSTMPAYPSASKQQTKTNKSPKKGREPNESTQPDMEVPANLIAREKQERSTTPNPPQATTPREASHP